MAAEYSTRAGDTFTFQITLSEYPASDGWAAVLHLRCGSEKQTVNLSADGDGHMGTVPPADTASWKPGLYDMAVAFSKAGAREIGFESCLAVQPDPAADVILPTALEAELAAVDKAIASVLAGEGVQAYTIQTQAGSRQIQRMSLADLRDHKAWLEGRIDSERAAMGQKPKNNRWKRIGIKFAP